MQGILHIRHTYINMYNKKTVLKY